MFESYLCRLEYSGTHMLDAEKGGGGGGGGGVKVDVWAKKGSKIDFFPQNPKKKRSKISSALKKGSLYRGAYPSPSYYE